MINLRYHIVSITAVFLALGIGLAFGAAFIDRATVDQLERNLGEIEDQNDSLERRVGELTAEVTAAGEVETRLHDEGLGVLLDGALAGVPVLILSSAGLDGDLLRGLETTLVQAGAQVPGIVRITDRVALDDGSEVDDLREILELPGADEGRLRIALTRQVRRILRDAAGSEPAVTEVPAGTPLPVPPLLAALIEAGFLELDPAETPPADFALIPAAGLRVLAISGTGAEPLDTDFLIPTLTGLVEIDPTRPDAPPPVVVAAQPTLPAATDENADEVARADFVAAFREDEVDRARLSTVDRIESFAGAVAAVLSLQHGAQGQVGHYGVGDGAQSLLPAPVEAAGD